VTLPVNPTEGIGLLLTHMGFSLYLLTQKTKSIMTMKKSITKTIASILMLITVVFSVHAQTNCPTPAGLSTTNITTNSAQLNWTLPAPSAASYYNVQYRQSGSANWTQSIAQLQTYSLQNLACGVVYEWRVQSVCTNSGTGSTSAFSNTVVFTTLPCSTNCPAPAGLIATNITTTSAVLSWTTTPGTLNAYNLRYRTSSSATWTVVQNTTSPYQLGNLTCNTIYEFQVQAICVSSSGSTTLSPWSASVTFTTLPCPTTCPAPTGLTATNITTTSATIGWNAVAGAGSYTIRYRSVGTTTWLYTSSTTNSKNLTGLICNKGYEWRVRANCSNSPNTPNSPYSAIATFTTAPCTSGCPTPTALASTNITAISATVSWSAIPGAASYTVRYRPVGTTAWLYMNSTAPSANLTALVCSTAYEWRVRANCSASNTTSAYSAFANFTTLPCPTTCNTPLQLTATNITSTGALLTWSPVAGAAGYQVQWAQAGSAAFTQANVTTNSYNVSGLVANTAYVFQVRTLCGGTSSPVYSPWSQLFTFLTTGPTNSCGVPTGLTATGVAQQGALLGWNAVAGAISYNIQYRPVNSNVWTSTTSNTNYKQVGSLTPGTAYEFQVQAVCAGINGAVVISAWSASYIFTTQVLLSLYPNPAGELITVEVETMREAVAVVEIHDLFGNLVFISETGVQSGLNLFDVNVVNLKEGIYSLMVRTGDEVQTSRIVIRR
jgi:hypothetical protein